MKAEITSIPPQLKKSNKTVYFLNYETFYFQPDKNGFGKNKTEATM